MKPTSFATRLFHRNVESLGVRAASYERQVDGANLQGSHAPPDSLQKETSRQPDRGLRDVHLAFLPERYQPLVDKEAEQEAKEARKLKKKEKYKKVKKVRNVVGSKGDRLHQCADMSCFSEMKYCIVNY